jgi:hypothetical protein
LVLAVVALAVLQQPAAAAIVAIGGLGSFIWVVFGVAYRLRRSRSPDGQRSNHRRERDRLMLVTFASGLALPTALAAADLIFGPLRPFGTPLTSGRAIILTLSVIAVPCSMLVSSSVDWYLIRAFRDGVFGAPACQADHSRSKDKTADYARYWILHRFVSEGVVFIAIIGAIAEIIAICTNAIHNQSSIDAFNDIGIVGILAWSYASLAKIKPAIDFLRFPTECALGAWQTGRNEEGDEISGFCLDASLDPGIQLLAKPRWYDAPDVSDPDLSVPLRSRKTLKIVAAPAEESCTATHCAFWIQHCERGNRHHEANPAQSNPAAATP